MDGWILISLMSTPALIAYVLGKRALKTENDKVRLTEAMNLASLGLAGAPLYVFVSGMIDRVPIGEHRMLIFLIPLIPLWIAHFSLLRVWYPMHRRVDPATPPLGQFIVLQGRTLLLQIGGVMLVVAVITGGQLVLQLLYGTYTVSALLIGIVGSLVLLAFLCASLIWKLVTQRSRLQFIPAQDDLKMSAAPYADRLNLSAAPPIMVVDGASNLVCVRGWPRFAILVSADVINRLAPVELEALIAHELGHVATGHLWKRAAVALLGGSGWLVGIPLLSWILDISPTLVALGISFTPFVVLPVVFLLIRRQEFEADALAIRAGADPKALIHALQELDTMSSVSGFSRLLNGLTHPGVNLRERRLFPASSHRKLQGLL